MGWGSNTSCNGNPHYFTNLQLLNCLKLVSLNVHLSTIYGLSNCSKPLIVIFTKWNHITVAAGHLFAPVQS